MEMLLLYGKNGNDTYALLPYPPLRTHPNATSDILVAPFVNEMVVFFMTLFLAVIFLIIVTCMKCKRKV